MLWFGLYLVAAQNQQKVFLGSKHQGVQENVIGLYKIKTSFFESWAVVVVISYYSIAALLPGLMCPGCVL